MSVERLIGRESANQTWNLVVYSCPKCHSAVNAQIDPLAIRNESVSEILGGVSQLLQELKMR